MAKANNRTAPSRRVAPDESSKIAKLREQRLASDAARREAGTWGDVSVLEIAHEPSGEVFVLSWKGRSEPNLQKLNRALSPKMSIAEHERLQAWLVNHQPPDFRQSLVGWNLSSAEALRVKEARIAEHKTGGRHVINEDPPAG